MRWIRDCLSAHLLAQVTVFAYNHFHSPYTNFRLTRHPGPIRKLTSGFVNTSTTRNPASPHPTLINDVFDSIANKCLGHVLRPWWPVRVSECLAKVDSGVRRKGG